MSKVEELRHHLVIEMADTGCRPHPEGWKEDLADAEKEVDSLIAAAREEGAEQEREKIRRMQLCGYRVQVSQFPDDERRHCRVETEVYGVAYTLVPASVLSPAPKEADNDR